VNEVIQAFLNHDLIALIRLIGLAGVFFIVFAESGLLVGFFLPGDSLLFVIGDNVGYEFGKRVGRKIFKREESLLFKPQNVIKAQEFYEKHGGKAIVLARFMPVVRTFVPIVAGIGKMDHKRFTFFNLLGGTIWTWGMCWLGYYLGSIIPDVDKYLFPIILLIIILSVLPPIWHLYKENKKTWHEKLREKLGNYIKYKM